MERCIPSSSRADRKTIEKNRRNHMKTLYSQLNSMIPQHPTREAVVISLPDQVEKAVNYIKKLQTNVEELNQKKERLIGVYNNNGNGDQSLGFRLPQIEIHEKGSVLEVVLITLMDDCHQSMFYEILRVLHEEGVDVVHASFSVVDSIVFNTIHCKVGGEPLECPLLGARISEKLKKLVFGAIN